MLPPSMSRCPDDGRPLNAEPGGALVCPGCKGSTLAEADLEAPVRESLALETREGSGAFARERRCPSCEAPMAPWRIGKMDAWVERCRLDRASGRAGDGRRPGLRHAKQTGPGTLAIT